MTVADQHSKLFPNNDEKNRLLKILVLVQNSPPTNLVILQQCEKKTM